VLCVDPAIATRDDELPVLDNAKALEQFFASIINGGFDRQIAFTNFHPASGLPSSGDAPIQILDPVNFDNNVAEHYEGWHRDLLVTCQYPAGVSDHGFWAVQSLVTEPGPAAAAIDQLPSDLGALRAVSQQLVFHCWADGDWAANGIEP